LKQRGFRVLRFWNDDVLREMNSVCDTIIAYVRDTSLQPWR
jgi:very-short-patch-repair endonuclease